MRPRSSDPTETSGSAILPAAIVALAFLGSIAAIRFATLDDRWYAAWVWHDTWIETAYQIAVAHGRFPKPSTYSFFLPYLVESHYFQAGIRLGTILLGALLAGNLIRRATRIQGSGVLFVLLFFAFAQNSFDHNLFVAYPFAWEFSWICWMAGLLGLMVAVKRQSMLYALIGATIWLIGLQEGFVPQTCIYVLFVIAVGRSNRKRWRYLFPYIFGLMTWLAVWLFWRLVHPSDYDGSQINPGAPIADIAKTVITYSIGGMPVATLVQGGWQPSLDSLAKSIDALSIIKAAAVFLGLVRILEFAKGRVDRSGSARIALVTTALFFLVFLPNVLIGITSKYQEWVRLGSHAYLYSHFSYFAWIGIGVTLLFVLIRLCPSKVLIICLAFLSACGSIITDASNFEVNSRQEYFGRRWDTMEALLRSEKFSRIQDGATIWIRDSSVSGNEAEDANYWQYVVEARTGKKLDFTPEISVEQSSTGEAYYLYLYDEPMTANQYALLAPLEQRESDRVAVATHAFIYPNSPNRSLSVGGALACQDSGCVSTTTVNGSPFPAMFESSFAISAIPKLDTHGVELLEVSASAGIRPQTLWVNFARNPVLLPASVSVEAGAGFYGWESAGDLRWNWGSTDAFLEIRSELDAPVSLRVEFWLVGGDSRTVVVSSATGEELARTTIDGEHPGFVSLPVKAERGVMSIQLQTDGPPLHERDGRRLAFQLRGLGLRRDEE